MDHSRKVGLFCLSPLKHSSKCDMQQLFCKVSSPLSPAVILFVFFLLWLAVPVLSFKRLTSLWQGLPFLAFASFKCLSSLWLYLVSFLLPLPLLRAAQPWLCGPLSALWGW